MNAGIPSPDGSIASQKAGPYAGEDHYTDMCGNAEQQVTKNIPIDETRIVWVRVENEGGDFGGGKLAFKGPPSPLVDLKFRYFHGATDVSGAAKSSAGYNFRIGHGETKRIRWQITSVGDMPVSYGFFCATAGNVGFSIEDVVSLKPTVVA